MRRVLHLVDTTGPGGAETVYLSVISRLDPDRWKSVPVIRGPGWVADTLRSLGHEPLIVRTERRYDVGYALRLRTLMRRHGIALVHAHLATSTLYGGLAAALAGPPTIGTLHGIPDLEAGRLRCRLMEGLTHRVVFVSESLRRRAVEEGQFREASTAVVRNGIDTERFRPGRAPELRRAFGAEDHHVLVGAVGNIRPLKDYRTWLRTAALLEGQDPGCFRFVVAGATDSPLYPELLDLRAGLGLDHRLEFAGFRGDVPEVLRAMDVLLVTSRSEGFSLATVQAMATGIPVVATRSGGPEEILRDGVEGLLRPVGDPRALADAVRALARHPEEARDMGRRGRLRAREEYSLDRMVAGYETLYEEALANEGSVRERRGRIRRAGSERSDTAFTNRSRPGDSSRRGSG